MRLGWHKRILAIAESRLLIVAGAGIVCVLLVIRQMGGLEPLELATYDQILRLRPEQGMDSRLLIVGITEADIRVQQQWPLSDRVIAQLFQRLQRNQPKAIGLDIFRDIPHPPGHADLLAELRRPNVVAIRYLGSRPQDTIGPPPTMSPAQIGFSEVLTDADGVTRRNLMFAEDRETIVTSFATRLAQLYLGQPSQLTPEGQLQLGNTLFPKLTATTGGYQNLDDRGYQILLHYRSSAAPARQVSLQQVLDGQVNPDWIRGRVVLIGVVAPSLKDLFFTPYSASATQDRKMPGVIIHAQMVSQILSAATGEAALIHTWTDWQEVLWIWLWAGLVVGITWQIRHPLSLLCLAIVALSLLFGIGVYGLWHLVWIPMAAPALAMLAIGGFAITYQMQQAQQQQQTVMKLLGQQTSPEIANALWQARDRLLQSGVLAGQALTVTVLFSDIRHFSRIAEQRSPEETMTWLNEYMRAMTHEVQSRHGIVNKFLGDGLMAVFGAPVPRLTPEAIAEDAQQAVACAVAMGDRLQILNQDWHQRGLPTIQMRIGIFTGTVMAGSLGSKERLEYAVIGDTVNIAARLESYEKERQTMPCRILIARETLGHLKERFQVEPWGLLGLPGKQQLIEVYQVLGYHPIA